MDVEPLKRVAIAAAYQAANILRTKFGNISRVEKKEASEIVTEADIESEKQIISCIRSRFPEHAILSEEGGLQESASEYTWIIDPLDGTVNFAHRVPIFCISIALTFQNVVVLGIILNPVNGELFSAIKDQGAFLNGKAINVSSTKAVSESLLVTGFPYNLRQILKPVMIRYENCLKVAQGVRRIGSAALDLCYVACGRFEAFWEQNLRPWDTAAGALLTTEAGGTVTTFSNRPFTPDKKEILATNGQIHHEMISLLELKRTE